MGAEVLDRGFEATTIDDIVAEVGISRRSFFRYFGTKEDVLLGGLLAQGEAVADALAGRPAGEGPWEALLRAMAMAQQSSEFDDEAQLAIGRMMLETPSLRARHIEKRRRWHELLTPLVAERIQPPPDRELAAAAIVATALACLDVATDAFVRANGAEQLEDLYAQALSVVGEDARGAVAAVIGG